MLSIVLSSLFALTLTVSDRANPEKPAKILLKAFNFVDSQGLSTPSKNMAEKGPGPHRYAFGEFVLDLDRGALQKKGADVPLRPKCFEVLCYLVEHHGVLLSKDELLAAAWADVIVTEDSLTHCLIEIRKALGDETKEMVRTVPRRGYLFDVPVKIHQLGKEQELLRASGSLRRHQKPSRWSVGVAFVLALVIISHWISGWQWADEAAFKNVAVTASPTSIAVLPFADMSPEGDQEYFADGLSEEVLNLLAQTPSLTVIARTSSFSFKGQNPDIETIAQKLNVAHVLEGSVRKDGDRVRVTAQLVDASNSAHLWSQTYDRTLDNIFSVQSEIASAVAGVLKSDCWVKPLRQLPKPMKRTFGVTTSWLSARKPPLKLGSVSLRKRCRSTPITRLPMRIRACLCGVVPCNPSPVISWRDDTRRSHRHRRALRRTRDGP